MALSFHLKFKLSSFQNQTGAKKRITLKRTIERLSRGLRDFPADEQRQLLESYTQTVKEHVNERTVYVIDDSRLANTIVKVYLMRWRIEEYLRFKKYQYSFEGFRVRSLNAIRALHRILILLTGLIGLLSEKREESLFVMELIAVSKRIYHPKPEKARSKFLHYAIADGFFAILRRCSVGIQAFLTVAKPSQQLSFFTS